MIPTDTITHFLYFPLAYPFSTDQDDAGKIDTWPNYGYTYNWGRPTVHSGGANVTMPDGHIERVPFQIFWQTTAAGQMASRLWYMD